MSDPVDGDVDFRAALVNLTRREARLSVPEDWPAPGSARRAFVPTPTVWHILLTDTIAKYRSGAPTDLVPSGQLPVDGTLLVPLPAKPAPVRTLSHPSHDFVGALYRPWPGLPVW